MKYQVEIQELLARTIDVEANNEEEAIAIVKKKYDNQIIVLDADDFCGPATIQILE